MALRYVNTLQRLLLQGDHARMRAFDDPPTAYLVCSYKHDSEDIGILRLCSGKLRNLVGLKVEASLHVFCSEGICVVVHAAMSCACHHKFHGHDAPMMSCTSMSCTYLWVETTNAFWSMVVCDGGAGNEWSLLACLQPTWNRMARTFWHPFLYKEGSCLGNVAGQSDKSRRWGPMHAHADSSSKHHIGYDWGWPHWV